MNFRADLKAYYDEEARQELRTPLQGSRVELRARFIEQLDHEGRASVVDFGAGPGLDAPAFIDAGYEYLGVDLAPENARLASTRGVSVIPGSITEPPLRSASFDAGWSMSTLMHLPEPQVAGAVTAMAAALAPGSPFMIGMWGGDPNDYIDDARIAGQRRLFSLRPPDENRALIETAGKVEYHQVWSTGPDGQHYQVFLLRTP